LSHFVPVGHMSAAAVQGSLENSVGDTIEFLLGLEIIVVPYPLLAEDSELEFGHANFLDEPNKCSCF